MILESSNNITAKAQGFILSANAAGSITPRKPNLLRVIGFLSSSSTVAEPEISS
jgi:hypothetical protein